MSQSEYLKILHDLRNEMRRTIHLQSGQPYEPVEEIDSNIELVKSELVHLRAMIIANSNDFMVEAILNGLFETIEEDEVLGMLREQKDSGVLPMKNNPKENLDKPYFE